MAFSEQKVNITCNSLTSYPYHDYNFYRAFLLVYLDFFVILEKIEIHEKIWQSMNDSVCI